MQWVLAEVSVLGAVSVPAECRQGSSEQEVSVPVRSVNLSLSTTVCYIKLADWLKYIEFIWSSSSQLIISDQCANQITSWHKLWSQGELTVTSSLKYKLRSSCFKYWQWIQQLQAQFLKQEEHFVKRIYKTECSDLQILFKHGWVSNCMFQTGV